MINATSTYQVKLKDPRWQQLRLLILYRDSFTCQKCGARDKSIEVHHIVYFPDIEPWDAPEWSLLTLCSNCHETEGELKDRRTGAINVFANAISRYLLTSDIMSLSEDILRFPKSYPSSRLTRNVILLWLKSSPPLPNILSPTNEPQDNKITTNISQDKFKPTSVNIPKDLKCSRCFSVNSFEWQGGKNLSRFRCRDCGKVTYKPEWLSAESQSELSKITDGNQHLIELALLRKQVIEGLKERRGYISPQPVSEMAAIRKMIADKYTPEDILNVWDSMKTEPFWHDKEVLMSSVLKQIGAKLRYKYTQSEVK